MFINLRHRVLTTALASVLATAILVDNRTVRAESSDRTGTVSPWCTNKAWVFAVGVLHWQKASDLASFSEKNRRDAELVDCLRSNGVPSDHIVFLPDKKATLRNINEQLSLMLAKTQPGDSLVFYYCGHGWVSNGQTYFGNFDAGDSDSQCLSVRRIVETIAHQFKGSQALFSADCCCSGSMAAELQRAQPPFKYATLTSVTAGTSSTSNWTFTQSLLDSFSGHRFADYNKDGKITFDELGRYIRSEMRTFEKQAATVASGAGFDKNDEIAKVKWELEPIPQPVQALYGKSWWPAKLVDRKGKLDRIHWMDIGWDAPDDDQWLDQTSVRAMPAAGTATAATSTQFAVGNHVSVQWKGAWYPAKILQARDSQYLIHYVGYNSSWDEWVGPTRVK